MRDVETLIYKTLQVVLAEGTGIPSGRVWGKRPDLLTVSKADGPNTDPNAIILPAISINNAKNATYEHNNYGESIIVPGASGMVTEYQPLAEIRLLLMIGIHAESKTQLWSLSAKLAQTLFVNRIIGFVGDSITGEYFTTNLKYSKEPGDYRPYCKYFYVECRSRILNEVVGHAVDNIDISIGVTYPTDNVIVVNSDSQLSTSSTGTIWS